MSFILTLHVFLAISSVILSTFILFKPTKSRLNGLYILFGGALFTGTILTLFNLGHLIQACISGIIYTAVVVGGIAVARKKIAAREVR